MILRCLQFKIFNGVFNDEDTLQYPIQLSLSTNYCYCYLNPWGI